MLGIFRHIIGRKASSNANFKSGRPPVVERLEPRIMLSGDGLLSCLNPPDPLQDTLLDTMRQVVQYAGLLDTEAQAEDQISLEPASSDTTNSDVYKPLFTLSQDNTNDESVNANLSVDIVNSPQVDSEPDLQLAGSDVGIALVLGVDLLDQNGVQPIGEDIDSECFESCQRQLIIEQLTDTLRVPHGPPDADGVLTSLDDVRLEYVDTGGQIDLVIRLNAQNSTVIEVFDNNSGGVLASYALSEINSLVIIGGDNSDDILTVDFSNPFSIPGEIIFAGGDGGYDRLVLIGNSELTAEYLGDGDDDGTVVVSGEEGNPINVSYSGLEPFVYLNEFGAVRNSGIFNYGNSPEILNVGTFTQSSGETLVVEIGGLNPGPGTPIDNGYDQINVTGTATLDGTLQIQLINSFSPSLGQNFEIMTFGSVVGDFATFSGCDLGGGLYLAPVKTAGAYRLDVVNYDPFAADVPENLNVVIDELLANHFDPSTPPDPSDEFVFTSSAGDIPNIITIGGMDLELQDVTLTFSGLVYDSGTARWTGQVTVEATKAALYPGLLGEKGIEVTDDDDDADLFAVAGKINLAVDNPNSFLSLDDLEEEDIGWPSFIDIDITNLRLKFDDFRGNDTQNYLNLTASFLGLDTGNEDLNELLAADNPFFGLKVEGSVENLVLDMDAIRQGIRNLTTGKISFPSSPIVGLDGIVGQISGKLFGVGSIEGGFILKKLTYDPDDGGDEPERSAVYLAWKGSISIADEPFGGRGLKFTGAFAISTRGPLYFYFSGGPIKRFEPTTGLSIEEVHLGVSFYTTIEGLQIETDFETDEVEVTPDGTGYLITLTIPGHDLEIGDNFRIKNPENENNVFYNDDYTVLTVNGDKVTYRVEDYPGSFVGNAEIIRLTIKDPFDLQDEGLQSIEPPESMAEWEEELDSQVKKQLKNPSLLDSWLSLFDEVVLGGGATLSIDPIPDTVLMYKVDFLLDSDFRIFLNGGMSLLDGLIEFPTRLYADLSDLFSGNGKFLYLQTQPEVPIFEPLLVYRGKVSFETLSGSDILNASVTENTAEGFWEIELELALDDPSECYLVGDNAVIFGSNPDTFDGTYEVIAVNDDTNTIIVKSMTNPGIWTGGGKVSNENTLVGFRIVLEGGVDLNIPGFKVENGELKPITVTTLTLECEEVAVEFWVSGPSTPEDLRIELSFDAKLSETHVGTIASAEGKFVVALDFDAPANEFIVIYGAALLTTEFDFLENVGLFMDVSGFLRINSSSVEKGPITLERADGTEVEVALPALSFALRLDGSVDFHIDFDGDGFGEEEVEESVFEISGAFVLEFSPDGFNAAVFREVGEDILPATLRLGPKNSPFLEFNVYAFLAIRSNGIAANLVLTLNVGAPGPLSGLIDLDARFIFVVNTTGEKVIFDLPGGGDDPNRPPGVSSVTIPEAGPANPSELADASLDDLINGNPWTDMATAGPYGVVFFKGDLTLLYVVTFNASGYVSLNPDVLSLEVKASGSFFELVSMSGSAFFSSEGEFEIEMSGDIQIGSSDFNIHGYGYLNVSYLDDNGKASGGDGNRILNVTGEFGVGGALFGWSFNIATLGVSYNSGSGAIYLHVSVFIFSHNFHIGTLKLDPPPPIVLGQVDNGVLTLNVGPDAGARNLFSDELDEVVLIEHLSGNSVEGEQVRITMFGHSEVFDNVLSILILDMGAGEDYVKIYAGLSIPVNVHFGDDDDTLNSAGSGVVEAYGDGGADLLIGGENADIINGGAGNDRIAGDLAVITYDETGQILQTIGSALGGNDTLYGNTGDDVILGGSGNDEINGGAGEDVLIGDDGTVTVSPEQVTTFTLTVSDFSGNDIIDGGADNDTLFGQKGEDILLGGEGDDLLYGDGYALGTETVRNILLGDGGTITRVDGLVTEIDTRGQMAGGADTIWGNGGPDVAMGGAAGDMIYGDAGDDILLGDTGMIVLDNGSLVYVDTRDEEFGGSDTIQGDMGDDIIIGGLNSSSDTLYGNAGDDIIIGDNGLLDFAYNGDTDLTTLDLIRSATDGLGGDDYIYGNAGSDVILGGTGGDEIQGDADPDVLIGDNADIFLSGFVPGSLTILGSAVNEIISTDTTENTGGADTITGNEASDIIIGGVNGSSDTLYGNDGDDVILGDNGLLDFAYNGDADLTTLDLMCSFTDGLGGGDLIYGNAGDDVLIGGTGGDSIDGNGGKDLILGDNGVLTDTNGDTSNPRFRVLEGTVIYSETPGVNDGLPLIDRDYQFNDPAGIPQWANWEVMLSVDSGGPDYIAGGPDNDQIFGQGGNDIIQGDGSIMTAVYAYRDAEGLLIVSASVEDPSDGDDYIEGNDGNDIIFGNLGQDDIIGGSSELFGLDTAAERTDGEDMIFGGAGTDLARNNIGDTSANSHARDADVILGDNGNIYRLVGINGTDGGSFLEFNYDNYGTESTKRIIVRAAELLDYTPGGMDYDEVNAVNDIGAPDEIHGESGDDFLYGMKGDDVIFGEGQDDDIIGGYGHDWISGGTGDDGVLGDDGRIYTSRNGIAEPLYGIDDLAGELDKDISTPDKKQKATINVSGELKKTVNLTPFKLSDPEVPQYLDEFDPQYADDIIFGGWGKDFLHGGDGDDAISGAEALTKYYENPVNPGDVLRLGVYRAGEFGAYNRDDPLSKVYWDPATGKFGGSEEFLLNFDHTEGDPVNDVHTDGDDVIFGDLGNDWLVGGTGRDHLYGGRGCDLLNADDNLETAGGTNSEPDGSETSYEDLAYGGAGSDVLIANIVGDRLIDWVGDFNRYVSPYTSFGANTISRNLKPRLFKFLYDLSRSDGADQTLGYSDDPRNGEPNGELGLVAQKDPDWKDQTSDG